MSVRQLLAIMALALVVLSACASDGPSAGSENSSETPTSQTAAGSATSSSSAAEAPSDTVGQSDEGQKTAGTGASRAETAETQTTDSASGASGATDGAATETESGASAEDHEGETASAPVDPVTATVLVTYDGDGQYWEGSGVVMEDTGLILTNAHVVTAGGQPVDHVTIWLTTRADLEPVPTYHAEVVAYDLVLDLAVIEITEDLGGNAVDPDLAGLPLGDSDDVNLGDELTIYGYPGIGGTTVSLTYGHVAGFITEDPVGVRAWVKTDATIAGGNSGGPAINEAGEVVAIPTQAGDVDCRVVEDTNGDGQITADDPCVPIGGDINKLRPVNFAEGLVAAAVTGLEYRSPYPVPEPVAEEEPPVTDAEADFTDIRMVAADDARPGSLVVVYPAGTDAVCADFRYSGMTTDEVWGFEWYVDGVLDQGASLTGLQSQLEGAGWTSACWFSDTPLANGVYEVVVYLNGDVTASAEATVGAEATTFRLKNNSSDSICGVFLASPTSVMWGANEITEVLEPGESVKFPVAEGVHDLAIDNCDGDVLYEGTDLEIAGATKFTLTD